MRSVVCVQSGFAPRAGGAFTTADGQHHAADPQTRTFDAEALIDNHQGMLKPGFFVKASIPSTRMDQVLFAPQKALSYAYGIYKVYAVTKEHKLKEREVKLGERLGEDAEIIDGVEEGDRLALPVDGQELAIKDGVTVKVVEDTGQSDGGRQRRPKG